MTKRLLDNAAIDEPPVIPKIGRLDSIELPMLSPVQTKPAVRAEVLDASEGLDNLTQLALDEAKAILEKVISEDDDNYGTLLRAKVAVLQSVLTTQARVDEGRFKKKQVDRLGELLELIRGEEARQVEGRVLN